MTRSKSHGSQMPSPASTNPGPAPFALRPLGPPSHRRGCQRERRGDRAARGAVGMTAPALVYTVRSPSPSLCWLRLPRGDGFAVSGRGAT